MVVDLRTVSLDIPTQDILTKDSLSVAVDAVVFYKIFEPMAAMINIEDFSKSTKLLASTNLRNVLGTRNLHEILSERDEISNELEEIIDKQTDPWGIKVERVEIKDVKLPVNMQRSMAAEAQAVRGARAKVVAGESQYFLSLV